MDLERASFPTDAWSEAMMRAELASPHGRYLVVEEAGRLLGYGGVRVVRGAADADIQTIAIAAGARGRGYGRSLLTELLATAREGGAREVFLEVRADNPVAAALYASEGFREIARRPRYYQPDDVDAVVMTLDLAGWAAARAQADHAPRAAGPATPPAPPASTGAITSTGGSDASGPSAAGQRRALEGTGWC